MTNDAKQMTNDSMTNDFPFYPFIRDKPDTCHNYVKRETDC
jgi:hypothetical protein